MLTKRVKADESFFWPLGWFFYIAAVYAGGNGRQLSLYACHHRYALADFYIPVGSDSDAIYPNGDSLLA